MKEPQIFHDIPWPDLVNQVDDQTCVQACLAMAAGVSIEAVISATGGEALRPDDVTLFLAAHGIVCEPLNQTGWVYGVYLISAPSLNLPRKMHRLVLSVRPDWPEHAPWQVLDPQCGRDEKKFYTDDDMASERISWCEPLLVRRPEVDAERIWRAVREAAAA